LNREEHGELFKLLNEIRVDVAIIKAVSKNNRWMVGAIATAVSIVIAAIGVYVK
jgi:hypothetical protein